MPSLDQSIVDLTNASAMILPAIAFCANAPIDEPEPELAFEICDGGNEHRLYQRHVTQELGFPRARRRVPTAPTSALIQKWLAHPDAERIYRAFVQYSIALRHGAAGREILAHAHFYMAVESLTKALLREECRRGAMNEDQIVAQWGIERKELDSEIRLRWVFGADREAYRAAKKASDGFEHGFANYVEIRKHAEAVARRTGAGVRRAIFDLLSLPVASRALLMADPYREPMDPRPLDQVVRGNLVGPAEGLAHNSQVYPCLRWNFGMADYLGEDDEGKMQFKLKDTTLTPLVGAKVGFQLTSFEVRRPDPHGRVTPILGTGTVRTPQEVLADTRRQIDDVRTSLPTLAQAMAEEQTRLLLASLGRRTKKLSRRDRSLLQRNLARTSKAIMPYYVGLTAISGQLPPNIARYILLERAMAETMVAGGVIGARRKDAFELLLTKLADVLQEAKILREQDAYPEVSGIRDQLIAYLAQPQHEGTLMPVLDHWHRSEECKTNIRYATQYEARAVRFLFERPRRYTQRIVIRLCEQYAHHAGLLQQQLRLLLALDHSATGEQRLHSTIAEKNLDSLLGSPKTSQAAKDLAQSLNRHIRNALAHGVPAIDPDRRRCVFKDKDDEVDLSFDDLFDHTMRLTVTTLCLLSIDLRVQARWMRHRIEALHRE
jgi:hypothetical protein